MIEVAAANPVAALVRGVGRLLLVSFLVAAVAGPAAAYELEGLERVDPELVRPVLEEVPEDAPRSEITGAIRRLYELGYFQRIDVRRDPETGELTWVFRERPFVVEVVTRGITELSDDKVEKAVAIERGVFLDPRRIRRTEQAVEKLYREEGYSDTDVRVHTEPVEETKPNEVRVVVEAKETGKVRILAVHVRGNESVSEEEIRARLESRPPNGLSFLTSRGEFDREAAERDRYRIEALYLERGFLKVQVDGPDVSYTPGSERVVLGYTVQEGLQYDLGSLTFDGDIFFQRETLGEWVDLEVDAPLNRVALEEGIRQIVEAYSDYGFAFARATPDFTYHDDRRVADVRLDIDRGPMVYIRRIEVQGNTKTRDKVVRRELLISEGELFSGSQLRRSRERVNALGFFEAVTFETRAVSDDQLDIVIQVTEKPTGTASAGIGYSSIDQFVGNLRLNFGNLMGYGIRLNLEAEFGGRRQTFTLGYTDPYFLDTPISLGVDLFRNRQEYFSGLAGVQSYTQENIGGSLSLGYKLGIYNRVFVTFRDELSRFSDLAVQSRRFFTGGETRSLKLTWRRDARNHPYDPTSGNLFLISTELAGGALGADHTFTKYRFLDQHFVTFFDFLTWMLKAEVGLSTAPGDRVPFAERYFVGGIYTLRGFDYRTVGPSLMVPSSAGDPYSEVTEIFVGGNKQVLLSSELIFPLVPPAGIKGVLFVDAGNTWLEEEQFFERRLRVGYGFGFRWFSPIGPLRFEWGFPWEQREGERPRVFEFSIGSYF